MNMKWVFVSANTYDTGETGMGENEKTTPRRRLLVQLLR